MRRAASMPSTLVKLPQAIPVSCPRYVNLTTSAKARLQIPQDCGSRATPGGTEGCCEKPGRRPSGAPSGEQARYKIGQQPRATGKAKVGTGQFTPKAPLVAFGPPLHAEQGAGIERAVERGRVGVQ